MQQDFIFGTGTGKTYQDIKRMRDIAEQFMQGAGQTPRTGMEGLQAVANALIARHNTRKADKMQAELLEQLGPASPIAFALMGIPQTAVPKYRYGTDFHPGGPAIVGEDGPEVLMLPRGAKVVPNPMTMAYDDRQSGGFGMGEAATNAELQALPPEERQRIMEQINQGVPAPEALQPDWYDPIGPQGNLSTEGMVQTAEAKGETATDAMPKLDLNVTEAQRTGQAMRLLQAESVLRELEETQGTRTVQKALEWLPDMAENLLIDEDYGRYMQARDAFAEAAMRADTGATINETEWPRILKGLMVQPGDGPERIAQRRAMRETIIRGLMASSGEGATIMPEVGKPVVPIDREAIGKMSDDDLLKALSGGN